MLPKNIRNHVALASGVTALIMVYPVGRISGVHFKHMVTSATASDKPEFNAVESGFSGTSLTLIHLVAIPVTNTPVNSDRSWGVVWFAGAEALRETDVSPLSSSKSVAEVLCPPQRCGGQRTLIAVPMTGFP